MSKAPQIIEIQGRTYKIMCPTGQEQALQDSAAALNHRLREIPLGTGSRAAEQQAIMASLNLTHELLLEQRKNREYAQAMESRIQSLQQSIEQVLHAQGKQMSVAAPGVAEPAASPEPVSSHEPIGSHEPVNDPEPMPETEASDPQPAAEPGSQIL